MRPKVLWGENAPGLFLALGASLVPGLRALASSFGYSFSMVKTDTALHSTGSKPSFSSGGLQQHLFCAMSLHQGLNWWTFCRPFPSGQTTRTCLFSRAASRTASSPSCTSCSGSSWTTGSLWRSWPRRTMGRSPCPSTWTSTTWWTTASAGWSTTFHGSAGWWTRWGRAGPSLTTWSTASKSCPGASATGTTAQSSWGTPSQRWSPKTIQKLQKNQWVLKYFDLVLPKDECNLIPTKIDSDFPPGDMRALWSSDCQHLNGDKDQLQHWMSECPTLG